MRSVIDRRRLLLGAITAAGLRSSPAWAETNAAACTWPPADWIANHSFPSRRWVKIVFVHTNERYNQIYMEDGKYIAPEIQKFSWTCRDYRENAWQWLNPYLMDFLFVLHWKYCKDEISILSGFRTPETNSKLEGAALNSQHLRANALDIHLPSVDNEEVAKDFKTFIYGGVGMYPLKHFTHLDCGPLRSWVG